MFNISGLPIWSLIPIMKKESFLDQPLPIIVKTKRGLVLPFLGLLNTFNSAFSLIPTQFENQLILQEKHFLLHLQV